MSLSKFRRSVPLNLVLVVPFLLEIFVAVGLTGFFSLRNGERAVQTLASQVQAEVGDRIDQHLDSYLEDAVQANRMSAEAIRLGILDPNNADALEQQFWQQIRAFSTLEYIYFGHEERGGYAGVGRSASEWPEIEETENYAAGDFLIYSTDNQGKRQTLLSRDPDYDPRRRGWYQDAVADGQMGWSEIYSFFPQEIPGISSTLPIYDAEGKLQGVLASDLVLGGIQDFLVGLNVLETGQTFLIERDGRLIASSHAETIFMPATREEAEPERATLTQLPEPVLQLAGETIQAEFPQLSEIQAPIQISFQHAGERYFVQVIPVENASGLDWLTGVILPESAFMAQINANTRTTIGLCILALLVAAALGVMTSYWIKQRLGQLTQAAEAMAQGQLEQKITPTQLRELDELGHSFNGMAEQLKQVIAELEESNITLEQRVNERTEALAEALKDLQFAQAQLIHDEKMTSLGQLVGGIAHEINNPLSFITVNVQHTKNYVESLLQTVALYQQDYPQPRAAIAAHNEAVELDFLVDDFPEVIKSIESGTQRILNIVSSLKTFAHKGGSSQKTIDIHQGIESTLVILQGRLKVNDAEDAIEVFKDYDDLPNLNCCPEALNQVFMHLIDNAIDAVREKKNQDPQLHPKIMIRTYMEDQTTIVICIADNGMGIPAHLQPRIFDPFFTTKPIGQGAGLGLSTSHQIIVEQHKGRLVCISEPGEGAEFLIALPCDPRV
ncbi:MAG: ATP-binding protein [Cyanobacteria bacterium P01_G01_bin.54]